VRRQQRATIVFLSVLIIAALGVLEVGAAQPGPRLWVEPAQLEVDPNENFSLQVMIEGIEDLGGFQIELAYDPSVVEVKQAAVDDFLTSTGRNKIPVGPNIDSEAGTVVLGAATFGDAAGAEGSGVLATISCTALGDGTSALSLQNVQVLDTAAGALSVEVEGGQVVVGDAEAGAVESATSAATSAEPSPSPTSGTAPSEDSVEPTPTGSADAPARTVRWAWVVAAVVVAGLGGAALLIGARRQGDGEGESM
jgi:hypothetical protein